ncbi:hypothetical protein BSKO_05502 [Bryopsis sp. KO-2023]|nr:hypothetical protein BSKO_05502 [Bryopsis sp. KO-2023]
MGWTISGQTGGMHHIDQRDARMHEIQHAHACVHADSGAGTQGLMQKLSPVVTFMKSRLHKFGFFSRITKTLPHSTRPWTIFQQLFSLLLNFEKKNIVEEFHSGILGRPRANQ